MRSRWRLTSRPILALFGAIAFAFCVGMAAHELGHAVIIRLLATTEATVFVHPFVPSHTTWDVNPAFVGYVDAAGPLGNILPATIVMALLWRSSSPLLLPLSMWGPMAYVQEGLNSTLQLLMMIPGTDSVRIVAAGVPYALVLGVAVSLLALGFVAFCLQLPRLSICDKEPFEMRLAVLAPGIGAYFLVMLAYAVAFSPSGITRASFLLLSSLALAALLAAIYGPIRPVPRANPGELAWPAVWVALGSGAGVVVLGLLLGSADL